MTKRVLSLLLAVVTVLTLAVPAFAEEAEPAEEPAVTQEPVEEEAETPETPAEQEPTEEPAVTEAPVEPAEPEATEEPVEPAEPEMTEEPAEEDIAPVDEEEPMAAAEIVSGTCGLNGSTSVTWKVEKNDDWLNSENFGQSSYTLTVSGSGPMGNYVFTNSTQDVPWREYRYEISRIIVEEGVTAIGDDAFRGCGYYHKIREVRISSTVARIGVSAFSGSEFRNVDVIIPETVTDIGAFAFSATGLTSIQLPSGLKKIGDYMLSGSKFTSIQIPASVTEIGMGAFSGCRQLTSVVIPDTVTTLGDGAFASCEQLTDVTLSKNLTKIGTDTFGDCYALKQIDIPESVAALEGYHAFGECRSMEKVTIRNPKCRLYTYDKSSGKSYDFVDLGLPKTTVICGYDGSTAQTWAKHGGYTFKSLGKAPVTYKYSAPTYIVASPASTGIKVSWTKGAGVAKYGVYYRTAGGSWTKAGDTTKTSYTWKKAKAGTAYELTVRCLDKKGKAVSDYGTVVPFTWYKAPSVTLTNTTDGVEVKWSDVKAPQYKVTVNGEESELANGGTIPAEVSNTKYTVTVQAVDANGVPMSSVASKSITYIAAPAVKSVEGVSSGIKISWDKVSGAAKYRVYYATKLDADGTPAWKKLANTGSTSYTWKKAKTGTKYYFTVVCMDKKYKKATSAKYDTAEHTITLLAAPSVTLTNTPDSVKVSWKAVKEAVKYAVTVNGEVVKADETGTAYTFKAENDTTYKVTVQSLGADERTLGKVSSAKSIKHLAAPVIKGIEASSSGIKISWDKVDGASRYRVYYATKLDADGTPAWKKLANTKSTSYNWKKANTNTTYYFTVVCMDSKYKKATSAKYDTADNAFTLLGKPAATSEFQSGEAFMIGWQNVPGAAKYRVLYRTKRTGWATLAEVEPMSEGNYFGWGDCTPGETYAFTVQCLDGSGKPVSGYYDVGKKYVKWLKYDPWGDVISGYKLAISKGRFGPYTEGTVLEMSTAAQRKKAAYTYYDINKDGTPEMLTRSPRGGYMDMLYLAGGANRPFSGDTFDYRVDLYINEDGTIVTEGAMDAACSAMRAYVLDAEEGLLQTGAWFFDMGGYDSWLADEGYEEISMEEYGVKQDELTAQTIEPSELTWTKFVK